MWAPVLESGRWLRYIFEVMRHTHYAFVRSVVSWLSLAALLLATGCTTFNHEWADSAKASVPRDGLLGRWEGTWSSEVNGHTGSLRCLVSRKVDGTYKARFHAIYQKVLGFGYTVSLNVKESNGVFHFRGQANLGWWAGGLYQYEGHAAESSFVSTYRCKYDHGTFQMSKPAQNAASKRYPLAFSFR
jgi:hypothetical protein